MDDGLSHKLAHEPIHQCVCNYSLSMFAQRRIFWSRLRRYTLPFSMILEPFSQSVPTSMLVVFGLSGYIKNIYICIMILSLYFILWFVCNLLFLRRLTRASYDMSKLS
jgi:hypothetical protein